MKNRKLGKILLVALFAMLFVALLAVNVSAAEPVTVDVTNEAELQAAVAADSTADVVNLVGTIQITGTVTVEKDVTITSATNATVVGKIAATELPRSATAFKMFDLAEGVSVTFAGNVVYSDAGIFLNGNNTLTLADTVQLLPGVNCHAIVDLSASSTTVNLNDSVLVEGKWAVYYEATVTEEGVVKSFNMAGGELATVFGVVSYGSGYDVVANVEDALIAVDRNLFHLDHQTADRSSVSFADTTVAAGGDAINTAANYNGDISVAFDGGSYTAAGSLVAAHNGVAIDLTLGDGTYSSTQLWNEGGTLTTTKTGGELTSNEFVLITAENKATFFDTLADALAAAVDGDVIEVWGTHTSGNVNVNASVSFKGNGTVTGGCHIYLADGKSLTLGDRTVWNTCAVNLLGNNTVTFTDNVVFASNNANNIIDATLTDTTVVISGNAKLTTNSWVADYTNSGSDLTTKTFTMTGGSFSGNYGIVYTKGNVKVVASIENAVIEAKTNIFHLDNAVAGNAENCNEITMTNVTATAGRYVFGLYPNVWANVTLNGDKSVYNLNGTAIDANVGVGALVICSASANKLTMTVADGTFNTIEGQSVLLWNGNAAPAVVTLLPTVLDTVAYADMMPNGAHVKKADGSVISCSILELAMANDADGDTVEITGTISFGNHSTVDKKITINGTGTVVGGNKVLFAGAESFTLSGNVTWQQVQIRPVADTTSTVNITDNVTISGTSTYTAVVLYDNATADLTVNLSKNAYISGERAVFVPNTTGNGSLTVTMNGGKITGNYPFVIDPTTAAIELDLANGTIEAQCNALHFNNSNASNVMNATLTNMTVHTGLNGKAQFVAITYSNSNVDMTINGGTYTSTGISFNASAGGSKLVVDLQAGTFTGSPVFNFTNNGYLIATVADACVLTPALEIANGARIVHENGYTYYQTLDKALDNAVAGDIIETIGANTLSATRTVDKDLTITGAEGTTVTASDISLFTVKNGAKLTLGGYTAWTTNKACISVGEGGAHVVLTDAVHFTSTGNDTQGAIFSDYTGNDDSTLEILATTVGTPKLTTTLGWAIDYQDASSTTTGKNNYSGVKTVKIIGAIFNTEYAIVYNNGGITPNVYVENAEFTAVECVLYLNNCYFETDDGINGNGNVGNYVFKNVTVHSCKEGFGTATTDCRANIEIIGGSYTSSGHIFNIDKAASVVNVTINGGNYTSGNFALHFNTTSLEALLTITGEAKFTGNWFLVSDGLLRADIAWDAITVETTNANGGIFASARVENADGTVTYGSIANVVAYAPAGSVIDIDGVPTISNVQIDKNLTITGIGTITAASGQSLFTVKNGAKLTIGGSTTYVYNAKGIVIGEGGGHVVITDTVKFTTTSGSQNGAAFYDERPDVNSTIEILKSGEDAPILESKGWTIDFEGDDNNPYATTKKINITGGTFSGSHPIVFNVGGVTADVSIKNATLTASNEAVYINNHYFETDDNTDNNGNVGTFVLEGLTVSCNHFVYVTSKTAQANVTIKNCNVTANEQVFEFSANHAHVIGLDITGGTFSGKNIFELKANGARKITANIEGGTYTASDIAIIMNEGNTLNMNVNTAKNCTATTTFTDGSQFLNSGSSFGTFNVKNTTISSANRVVSVHWDGEYDLTFTDCTVSAGERVYAFHDTSECSLTLHGGTHTLTNTNINGRFGIYISGTDSLLNLTVDQKAKVISNNPYDNGNTGTIFTNGAGATMIGSFKNAYVRGAYVFRAGSGTMDMTLEDTTVEVIGTGAGNYNGTASAFFLAGTTEQHKVHLKKGTVLRPIDDDTLNPNGVMNGFNIRENVSFDITFDEGVEILANGFCFKNNTGRCLDSKLTINGGTYTAGGTNQVIAFYGRTTDDTKPTTLVINGGTFSAEGGHALQFFSDKGLVVGYINGGTFTSNSGTTIYAHANRVKDGETVVSEGQSVLNIYNCVCITGTNDAALYASGDTNDLTDGVESIVNVYGGYFEGHNLCAARASSGGVLNVYGGTFRFENKDAGHWGAPIRSGTGSNVGIVYIYGGNFYTTATAASGLFTCMNGNSYLTVHGGYNGVGGRVIFEDLNDATNGGDITHEIGLQVANHSIYMIDGAAVRLASGSNGLRFKGIVTAEAMAYINGIADEGTVRFGTIIAPADYLENAYAFTAAELDRLGLKYLDLKADNGLTANEDGSYTINAAITNIKEENYNRNFAATCYVEYEIDGNTVRVYSNFRELKNQRSIAQVARIALTDTGRYNESQREVLAIYAPTEQAPVLDIYLIAGQSNGAGCSNFTADFKNSDPNFTNGYSNVLYHGVSVGGSDYPTKRIYTNVPVKAGYGCGTSDIGPELGMAKALSQYYNEETGRMAAIVKYAYGGTGLADTISGQNFPEGSWCPPSWLAEHGKVDEYKSGGLYRAFVMQIQSAISDYRALGYEINVVGGYWMQGCNDRYNDPNVYADMFECWLSDLRNDVYAITRDEADLKMPMVVGEISDYFNENNYEGNKAFTQMQREQIGALENVYVINNGTIPTVDHSNDKAHWDSHSALWIGQNVGITFLTNLLDSEYVVSDEDLVAEITLGGEVIGRYDNLVGALNDAPDGAVVELKKDLELYSTLAIGNRNAITLNGNDHKIDFVLPASDNHTSMIIWYDTNITINDLHISNNNNAWGTQLRQNANVIWNGGSITTNNFCFVINTNGDLTVGGGEFNVTAGSLDYSAVIYVGNNDARVTVTDGIFNAANQAVGVRVSDKALVTVTGGDWTVNGGDYILELLGTSNTLVLDKENTKLNEGYKIAPIYNAGQGHVEDDAEPDPFVD